MLNGKIRPFQDVILIKDIIFSHFQGYLNNFGLEAVTFRRVTQEGKFNVKKEIESSIFMTYATLTLTREHAAYL